MEGGQVTKMRRGFFCLFFCLFFVFVFVFCFCFVLFFVFVCLFVCFCFSFLKTNEICLGSTQVGILYQEKVFHAAKKSGKLTLHPLKNIPLTPLQEALYEKFTSPPLQIVSPATDMNDLRSAMHFK